MDAIVEQALVKWPNVPHCYGWLALDARGAWRMRSAPLQQQSPPQNQQQNLIGEKIVHPVLLGFINRNYTHDEQGRWYFQNGPQRVYIDLERAPYIARSQPSGHFVLHTGEAMTQIETACLSAQGRLYLQAGDKLAMLDDRDLAQCLMQLHLDGDVVSDDVLLAWLNAPTDDVSLSLQWQGLSIPLKHILDEEVAARFGFICLPRKMD